MCSKLTDIKKRVCTTKIKRNKSALSDLLYNLLFKYTFKRYRDEKKRKHHYM